MNARNKVGQITSARKRLLEVASPRSFFKEYPAEEFNARLTPHGGGSLQERIGGSKVVAVMAVTLGIAVDTELKRLQATDLAEALEFDQSANDYIEEVCDEVELEIEKSARKLGFSGTKRYSPGYGTFSLENQSVLLDLIAPRAGTGITVTESNLLVPQKTVTAVIGYLPKTK